MHIAHVLNVIQVTHLALLFQGIGKSKFVVFKTLSLNSFAPWILIALVHASLVLSY